MWYAMHMRAPGGKMMNKASTWQTKHAAGKMRCFRLKSIWRSPEMDARFANGKQNKNDTNLRLTALSMQQETILQHPNIQTKHMEVIYRRCLTKEEHWATAKSHHNRFKQAWWKCKKYQVHRLSENTSLPEINIRKACLEQANTHLQELIIAKQGMTWIYSKHRSKVPY